MNRRYNVPSALIAIVIAHVNRKRWWHVPPADPLAYRKRGKFLASTFSEAEFYGRPSDEPHKVAILKPLVGDEKTISTVLGIAPQFAGMTLKQIQSHDARWRKAALMLGYDSILLMSPKGFARFKAKGQLPRSMELNLLCVDDKDSHQAD